MKTIACVTFLLLITTAAFAQLKESTTVEVVQVPVYVSARGAAVTNLTRDNFRLFVNGAPQSIDYFDVIDFAMLSPDEARDPRQRRLYLLVFDLTFSSPNALHRAQQAAERIIDAAATIDTFGIATLVPARGANIVVPFSHDRVALLRAVRNLRPARMPDPLGLTLTPSERERIAGGTLVGGGIGMFITPEENALREGELQSLREIIEESIADLADLAVRVAPLEGVKHIVLLSSGFDSALMHGATRRMRMSDIRQGPLSTLSLLNPSVRAATLGFSPQLLTTIRRMNEVFARSGVFLDAIDIAGLRPMQEIADNEALYTLTRDTGGEVIDRRNDLAGAMQHLADLQRLVYVLSFNARNTGRANNKIAVKLVNGPAGAHLSHRASYASVPDLPDLGDPLRLADIVTNDIPQSGVTTKATVDVAPGSATIHAEIAGGELAAQANGMALEGEALLYVFAGPNAVAFDRKQITIERQAMANLASQSVRLRHTFDLPAGRYAAKVLIRLGAIGSFGFARADFTVP